MDLSLINSRPGVQDHEGNFVSHSDKVARYLIHKFPNLNGLVLKRLPREREVRHVKLSQDVLIDLFNYITTVPNIVDITNFYMENGGQYLARF